MTRERYLECVREGLISSLKGTVPLHIRVELDGVKQHNPTLCAAIVSLLDAIDYVDSELTAAARVEGMIP